MFKIPTHTFETREQLIRWLRTKGTTEVVDRVGRRVELHRGKTPIAMIKFHSCKEADLAKEVQHIFHQTGLKNIGLVYAETSHVTLTKTNTCATINRWMNNAKRFTRDSMQIDRTREFVYQRHDNSNLLGPDDPSTYGVKLQITAMSLFDLLVGNVDRHDDNFLLTTDNPANLILIDHDRIALHVPIMASLREFHAWQLDKTLLNLIGKWSCVPSKWDSWGAETLAFRTFWIKYTLMLYVSQHLEEFMHSGGGVAADDRIYTSDGDKKAYLFELLGITAAQVKLQSPFFDSAAEIKTKLAMQEQRRLTDELAGQLTEENLAHVHATLRAMEGEFRTESEKLAKRLRKNMGVSKKLDYPSHWGKYLLKELDRRSAEDLGGLSHSRVEFEITKNRHVKLPRLQVPPVLRVALLQVRHPKDLDRIYNLFFAQILGNRRGRGEFQEQPDVNSNLSDFKYSWHELHSPEQQTSVLLRAMGDDPLGFVSLSAVGFFTVLGVLRITQHRHKILPFFREWKQKVLLRFHRRGKSPLGLPADSSPSTSPNDPDYPPNNTYQLNM